MLLDFVALLFCFFLLLSLLLLLFQKQLVFHSFPNISVTKTGSVSGMPGEGPPRGKSGFRVGGVAKSTKIVEKSMKIGSLGIPGTTFAPSWLPELICFDLLPLFNSF